jgi:hypothetical protein
MTLTKWALAVFFLLSHYTVHAQTQKDHSFIYKMKIKGNLSDSVSPLGMQFNVYADLQSWTNGRYCLQVVSNVEIEAAQPMGRDNEEDSMLFDTRLKVVYVFKERTVYSYRERIYNHIPAGNDSLYLSGDTILQFGKQLESAIKPAPVLAGFHFGITRYVTRKFELDFVQQVPMKIDLDAIVKRLSTFTKSDRFYPLLF